MLEDNAVSNLTRCSSMVVARHSKTTSGDLRNVWPPWSRRQRS